MTLQIGPRLLNHPWYRKWECGELPKASLRYYAQEYYSQVSNFPRYLSRIHSQVADLKTRQTLLGNLLDEENGTEPHPELWLDFAEALGLDRAQTARAEAGPAARALVEEFRALADSGQASGLGALLAYESQVPDVAKFKRKALEQHYLDAATREKGTRFFAVHEGADVWHTRELEALVAALPEEEQLTAQLAADRACQALWRFLDAMPN